MQVQELIRLYKENIHVGHNDLRVERIASGVREVLEPCPIKMITRKSVEMLMNMSASILEIFLDGWMYARYMTFLHDPLQPVLKRLKKNRKILNEGVFPTSWCQS